MFRHYVLRSLLARGLGTAGLVVALATVIGGCVVCVAFVFSLQDSLAAAGRPDNLVVLSHDAVREQTSDLPKAAVDWLKVQPEVATDADGPWVSYESIGSAPVDGADTDAVLRAISPAGWRLHDNATIVQGRLPAAGARELVVGTRLSQRSPQLALGGTMRVGKDRWPIVGVFSANGTVLEDEAWTPYDAYVSAVKNVDSHYAVLRVASPAQLPELVRRAATSQFKLTALPETEHFQRALGNLPLVFRAVAIIIAILMAGAIIAAGNTLQASISERLGQFTSLWVLGFRRRRLLVMVIEETLTLAFAGAVLGTGLAFAVSGAPLAALLGSDVDFRFAIDQRSLIAAGGVALAVGLLSSIQPILQLRWRNLLHALS